MKNHEKIMNGIVRFFLLLCLFFCTGIKSEGQKRLPIIDMHLHAHSLTDYGGGSPNCTNDQKIVFPGWDPRTPITLDKLIKCESPIQSSATDEALLEETLAMLERFNIFAIASGSLEMSSKWRDAAPHRLTPGLSFSSRATGAEEYRQLYQAGKFGVFGESGPQYRGLALDDAVYDPYFALAEELDIPVGVHLGEGPAGGAHFLGGGKAPTTYRARLTSPLQVEEVLLRHPKLRIYVMHYGSPLVDEMITLMYSHPQVYVDIAMNNWGMPREHFYSQLKRLVDAGFEERIMWGSDQMIWPKAIPVAIETIEKAPFLTEKQKRDIFYNNAARFLRFSKEEIARHHKLGNAG